ncbi:MAG: elongation factor 1-beta [Thermoplasmata archaeon]|jgi:elongation factor 1-beta
MGDVGIIYKILPTDVSLNINKLSNDIEKKLQGKCRIKGVQIIPIAFGLQAIKMFIVVPDEENASEKIENLIKEVDGVGEVDVEELSLL